MGKGEINLEFFLLNSNLQILKNLEKERKVMQFKDLRNITNPKTNKKFSSSTIAKSLKELEEIGVIENKILKEKKKKVLGYTISDEGEKVLFILKESEEKLKKII